MQSEATAARSTSPSSTPTTQAAEQQTEPEPTKTPQYPYKVTEINRFGQKVVHTWLSEHMSTVQLVRDKPIPPKQQKSPEQIEEDKRLWTACLAAARRNSPDTPSDAEDEPF